jgi:pimeloyl-ACP methyl ester carboxylesterase
MDDLPEEKCRSLMRMFARRGDGTHSGVPSWLWRGLRIGALAYLGLLALVALLQGQMIYPGAARQGHPGCALTPARDSALLSLRTADGERVMALFGPAMTTDGRPRGDASRRPTLIFFYGNAMCLADATGLFGQFRHLGLNVLVPDYVGYGMSGGSPSEDALYATADAAYAHLLARNDIAPGRIISSGWSLGGAVAIDLAHRKPVAGLAVISTFTSAADMGRQLLPFFPYSVLLRSRFESQKKIAAIRIPTLIIHGRRDSIIPYAMAEQLAGSAAGRPVTTYAVDRADHNDIFDQGGRALMAAIGKLAAQATGL